MLEISKPNLSDVPEYFHRYVNYSNENDLFSAFINNKLEWESALTKISEKQENFRYAPEKWSVKELLVHVLDAERIFQYRALRFLRKDATNLQGFSENEYVPESNSEVRTLSDIGEEFKVIRENTLQIFKFGKSGNLDFLGSSSGNPVTAKALGWIIVGHCRHHLAILKERYLLS